VEIVVIEITDHYYRKRIIDYECYCQQLRVKRESLDANIALIHHYARLAGKIDVEMKR